MFESIKPKIVELVHVVILLTVTLTEDTFVDISAFKTFLKHHEIIFQNFLSKQPKFDPLNVKNILESQ